MQWYLYALNVYNDIENNKNVAHFTNSSQKIHFIIVFLKFSNLR